MVVLVNKDDKRKNKKKRGGESVEEETMIHVSKDMFELLNNTLASLTHKGDYLGSRNLQNQFLI